MKKRTGVERAVIVMAVVVVLLAIALIVVNAAGIRIHKPAPETPVETNLPQFPFSDEPELILGSGQAPSRDAQQAVSVGGEDKTMQLVTGSFKPSTPSQTTNFVLSFSPSRRISARALSSDGAEMSVSTARSTQPFWSKNAPSLP